MEQAEKESLERELEKSHRINIAFGLSDFADNPTNVEDHLYGNLEAKRTQRLEDGTIQYSKIETVACESDYLKDKFFPARPFVQE